MFNGWSQNTIIRQLKKASAKQHKPGGAGITSLFDGGSQQSQADPHPAEAGLKILFFNIFRG